MQFKEGTKVRFHMRNGSVQTGKLVRAIEQPNGLFYEVHHLNDQGKPSGVYSRRASTAVAVRPC